MGDVSFISAMPAKDFSLERRTPEQPAGKTSAEQPAAKRAEPAQLPNKTKVMTEFRTAFEIAYTFIDPDTDQVVARWPVAPPLSDDSPGAQLQKTL
jgi:hypothetical protein